MNRPSNKAQFVLEVILSFLIAGLAIFALRSR